jgi:hypothetical protein
MGLNLALTLLLGGGGTELNGSEAMSRKSAELIWFRGNGKSLAILLLTDNAMDREHPRRS